MTTAGNSKSLIESPQPHAKLTDSPATLDSPYYHLVPKDFQANLGFRRELLDMTRDDPSTQEELWIMCSRDFLFYINSFCWTYNPKKKDPQPRELPFITWPYQDTSFAVLVDCIGSEDLVIEKSRDMGASWMCLMAFEWVWHFHSISSFLLVSRKEDLVDKTNDPRSLMWKIDYMHKNQPRWLLPSIGRSNLHIINHDTGSTIDGESTTGDVARGDRRTAILLDEFASVDQGARVLAATGDATDCRVMNSTPKGVGNTFYDEVQNPKKRKLRFHWSVHPEKGADLYWVDGKARSPWYDDQCERRSHPMEVAQELDIDYLGSDYVFFDAMEIGRHLSTNSMSPFSQGDLDFTSDTCDPVDFLERKDGPLLLWLHLGGGKVSDTRSFAMGVDVSAGTGASNSCLSIVDSETGEKVAEFASPNIRPERLAQHAVALARWFNNAFMMWESNGPGRQFGSQVIELGYRTVYYRTNEMSLSKRLTDIPGWSPTKDAKLELFGQYRKALVGGHFINRSRFALKECHAYVYLPNGGVAHARAVNSVDPTGARENHGDRVVADALACKAMRSTSKPTPTKPPEPLDCLASRRNEVRLRREKELYW